MATGDKSFNAYVMPKRRISADASRVNGFCVIGNQLHQMGTVVESSDLETVIARFLDYIESFGEPAVLVSHNLPFDLSFLYEAVVQVNQKGRFQSLVRGGLCTLAQARAGFKGKEDKPEKNTVEQLAAYLLGPTFKFVAHDARGDAEAVCRFFPELELLSSGEKHSVTIDFYVERRRRSQLFAELVYLLKENDIIKAPFLEASFNVESN